ncbi:hypothetical protein M9458_058228, partial [Cirrhinus mrigala]
FWCSQRPQKELCFDLSRSQKGNALARNRTRVNCLEGSYAHHYTTNAGSGCRLLRSEKNPRSARVTDGGQRSRSRICLGPSGLWIPSCATERCLSTLSEEIRSFGAGSAKAANTDHDGARFAPLRGWRTARLTLLLTTPVQPCCHSQKFPSTEIFSKRRKIYASMKRNSSCVPHRLGPVRSL